MNKQQLAQKIWASANQMRSKIEANEYKDYILGFIFYKYLSDKEVKFLKENDYDNELLKTVSEEDAETVEWIQKNIGYFIAYKDLFSTWLTMGKDFDVSNVRDALSAFSRLISSSHKRVFEKVFDTLQTGLSKLGDSSGSQTKAISGLLTLIKDIPMDGKQDYDVLGFIYEYLISNFAANAGKKAGEFYTPHEVSLLMSEIVASHLKGKSEIKIYDPTSGSGSLLINIGQSVAKYMSDDNNIQYYAQELKENTYNLTRMNLVMRGIDPANIITRNGDTLEEDWPYFDENDPVNTYNLSFDCNIFLNPIDILSRLCISVIIARVLFQLDNIQVSSGINPKDIKPAIPQNKLPAIDTSLLIYTERHPKYRNANFHPLHQFIFEKLFAGELLFFYADVYDRFRLNISNGRLWDSDFYFANWLFSPLLQIL